MGTDRFVGRGGTDSSRDVSKKRSAVSTKRERLSKAARTGASSDKRYLKELLVPRRHGSGDEGVEVEPLVRARNERDSAVLLRVWESPDVMAYVKQGSQ